MKRKNKLYYKEYIMTLCLKNKEPIYIELLGRKLYYNKKYTKSCKTILNINNYKELLDKKVEKILYSDFSFVKYYWSIFGKEKIMLEPNIQINRNNFLYLSLVEVNIKENISDLSMKELKENLSVQDYIKFCKDKKI